MTSLTAAPMPARLMFIVNDLPFFLSHRKILATAAKKVGNDVAIACPDNPGMPDLAEEGFAMLPIKMRRGSRSLVEEWRTFRSVWRAIAQFRPDVLHLITSKPVIYGGLAARAMGIPCLSAISGLGYVFTGKTLRHRLLKPAVTRAYGVSVNRADSHFFSRTKAIWECSGMPGC